LKNFKVKPTDPDETRDAFSYLQHRNPTKETAHLAQEHLLPDTVTDKNSTAGTDSTTIAPTQISNGWAFLLA
jgi:hypothetical protein